jgi:hypothetical protein
VTPLQAVGMWLDFSESHDAIWLKLPEDDRELAAILIQHLPSTIMLRANPITWQAKLIDAGDDSGDAVLELPDELLMQLGWAEDDTLEVSVHNAQISVIRISSNSI